MERTYRQVADRARGFAYYVKKKGYKRTGILSTNTPAFLEAIFGIGAAGAVNVGMFYSSSSVIVETLRSWEQSTHSQDKTNASAAINYRLKPDDITYIFTHADVDSILVDAEFLPLLSQFRAQKSTRHIPFIVDTDLDGRSSDFNAADGTSYQTYDSAVLEGLEHDALLGNAGWAGLELQAPNEEGLIALAYTSGTTARPKGVEYTHRGAYLAALGNVIESGLNYHEGRAGYLWTLPMFHAMGVSDRKLMVPELHANTE